jgi:hypothetical protein
MLSVPRYRMTLTGVVMTKKHVSKTMNVSASEPHQSIVASSEKFKVVVGSVAVENLHEDVMDCVYVCRSQVALLVFQTPMTKTPFPVFIVDERDLLDFFQYVSDVTVSFDLLCSPMAEISSAVAPSEAVGSDKSNVAGGAVYAGNEFFPKENWISTEKGVDIPLDSNYCDSKLSLSKSYSEAARSTVKINQSEPRMSKRWIMGYCH